MTVLNWKNVHFNLIVGPNHMLSQEGSLRFQQKRCPETEVASTTPSPTLPPSGKGYTDEASTEVPFRIVSGDGSSTETDSHKTCKLALASKDSEILKFREQLLKLMNKPKIINEEYDNTDIEELDSEADLVTAYSNRPTFIRNNPQSPSDSRLKCDKCYKLFRTKGDLNSHMKKHEHKFQCQSCSEHFNSTINLNRHKDKVHTLTAELNCDDCEFQANTGPELRKHLNSKSHKAVQGVEIIS